MWVGFAHAAAALPGEDGYDLWLRYRPLQSDTADTYKKALSSIAVTNSSPTLAAARDELVRGLSGLLGTQPEVSDQIRDGAIVLGTPTNSTAIRDLKLDLRALGREGYVIENRVANG
ncbi:MAG TPA: alpha-glucuronidase family glycosyl hydrolase, partial [Steroidobacteraceae bacterium]|nr:alpha-glucuronidase family glycosyl hydrolase [Steroidobacteraceae bacterium]